jgi:catechol 2,3-dioxygenase-like lactoylglutathione lyase family enzyme
MATAAMTQPAVKLSALDHVVVYVSDLARSKAFYVDVLGMTVRSAGAGYAFLWCGDGGQQIGLFEAEHGRKPNGADLNHLAFSVPSGTREEIVAALAAHGITARGRRGDPDCIYFDDPDGHCLQLVAPARRRTP